MLGLEVIDWWSKLFVFDNYGELVVLLQNSIIAGALLGVVGGLIGVFVIARDMPFAVHGISELSFAGASAGLLFEGTAGEIGAAVHPHPTLSEVLDEAALAVDGKSINF